MDAGAFSMTGGPRGQTGDSRRAVPRRALWISLAALAVPLYAAVLTPETASDYEVLLWLLALVPAFLLAYYRGWAGATLALAVGMGLLAVTQVVTSLIGKPVGNWVLVLGVVVAFIAISLGVGWISELLHRARDRAEELALTDELTRLPNRRHFQLVLDQEFAAARRGRSMAVAMFDLDNFKRFNDVHGHAAGDDALRGFARVLHETTRQMNLSARLGGEEFVSVLSDTDVDGALVFVNRVMEGLRRADVPHGGITVSCGLAAYEPEMRSPEVLVAAADQALYRAKSAGRNRVEVYQPETGSVPAR